MSFGPRPHSSLKISHYLVALILLVLLWWIAISVFHVPDFILPTPIEVGFSIWERPSLYWNSTLATFAKTLLSFGISLCLGVSLGLVFVSSPKMSSVIWPPAILSQVIPRYAILPYLLLVFGASSLVPPTLISVSIAFYPVFTSIVNAFNKIGTSRIDHISLYSTSKARSIRSVIIPFLYPSFMQSLKTCAIYAFAGIITAELLGLQEGLGALVILAYNQFLLEVMFASLLITLSIGFIISFSVDRVVNFLLRKRMWQWSYLGQ